MRKDNQPCKFSFNRKMGNNYVTMFIWFTEQEALKYRQFFNSGNIVLYPRFFLKSCPLSKWNGQKKQLRWETSLQQKK